MTTTAQSRNDWTLSLDLLIARAALDENLRRVLIQDTRKCCANNGVVIPTDVMLVITDAEQETLVKQIPSLTKTIDFTKTSTTARELEPMSFNGTTENTNTNENAEAESTAVEAVDIGSTVVAVGEAVVVAS